MIQQVKLELNSCTFYCPVTGQLVLSPDDFNSSPALLFSYLEGGNKPDNMTSEIMQLYDSCLKEIGDEFSFSKEDKAFESMIAKLDNANYVLFTINYDKDVFHMAFDMNLTDQGDVDDDDENDFEKEDVEELSAFFEACQNKVPNEKGYAVFSTDDMGICAFGFCDTAEEFTKLCTAVTFIEAFNEGYSVYGKEKLKELNLALLIYVNEFGVDNAYLMERLNELLESYHINFMGPVKDLYMPKNKFTNQLIEEFGNDPIKNKMQYLNFLKGYCRE